MQYRDLGRTGLKVSVISQGGAAIGQQYGPVTAAEVGRLRSRRHRRRRQPDRHSAPTTARAAPRSCSARCCRAAGGRRSTSAPRPAGSTATCSTSPPPGCGPASKGRSKRLRTDHVDILLAHDIEFADDYERVFTETAGVLHDLKREGKCRFVGMSCYPLGLLRQAIERCQLDVVISYCHFSCRTRGC